MLIAGVSCNSEESNINNKYSHLKPPPPPPNPEGFYDFEEASQSEVFELYRTEPYNFGGSGITINKKNNTYKYYSTGCTGCSIDSGKYAKNKDVFKLASSMVEISETASHSKNCIHNNMSNSKFSISSGILKFKSDNGKEMYRTGFFRDKSKLLDSFGNGYAILINDSSYMVKEFGIFKNYELIENLFKEQY